MRHVLDICAVIVYSSFSLFQPTIPLIHPYLLVTPSDLSATGADECALIISSKTFLRAGVATRSSRLPYRRESYYYSRHFGHVVLAIAMLARNDRSVVLNYHLTLREKKDTSMTGEFAPVIGLRFCQTRC